jgi:hypothetical protein
MTTLAWENYSAGIDPRPWWTYIIEYMIILFPAINVLSAAPLSAIACAANAALFFKSPSKTTIYIMRACIWIGPTLIAIGTHDLGLITAITGVPEYILAYATCSLLYILSRRHVRLASPYDGWWGFEIWAYVNIALCFAATILTVLYIGEY